MNIDRAHNIRTQLQQVQQRLQQLTVASPVTLIAVSKTKPVTAIEQAYHAGQRAFGENYVQEGMEKTQALAHLADIEWHFIGPLQSNKTKEVAQHFDWVQSLDREKIARRLNEQRPANMPPLQVLIQVNIDDEASKSGIEPDQLASFAQHISELPQLRLRGLMAIPAPATTQADQERLAKSFARMHDLFLTLQSQYSTVDTLSMGMSGDIELAITQGANMVRVGSAIFGART